MVEFLAGAALIAATLTTGLSAGLFYGFSCAVMPGLRRADDRSFVDTMQRINVAIINGWFMLIFVGPVLLTALAGGLHIAAGDWPALPGILVAFVLYIAALVVTGRCNIPLNNALDSAGPPDRVADLAAVRTAFEARWVRWNTARTVLTTASFACLIWALVTG